MKVYYFIVVYRYYCNIYQNNGLGGSNQSERFKQLMQDISFTN